MRAARWFVPVFAFAAIAAGAALVSCGGDGTGPPSGVGTVKVSPAVDSLPIGGTVTLSATVLDANGQVVSGASVFWNTENANKATVSSNGAVTAVDTGTVKIAASSQGISGFATITVILKPVAAVTVTPPSAVIKVGQTVHLQANPVDAAGNPLTGRTVTWTSSDPTVASVDNAGIVTGVSVGPTTITATCEQKTGSAAVSVGAPTAATITVSPTSVSITVGGTSQLASTVKDSNNAVIAGAPVSWASDKQSVASVSSTGLVTGVAQGNANVTATSGAAHVSVPITVAPVPANAVIVSPSSATLLITQTVPLQATVTDANGNPLAGRPVTWSSSNSLVASVSTAGLVLGVLPGTATISATSGAVVGKATIVVKLVPTSQVNVTPDAASLFVGQTQQLTAVALDSAGNQLSGRTATWSSTNISVASVSSAGVVTAVKAGNAVVIAKIEGQTGTASILVSLVPVKTVSVAPALDTLIVGKSMTLVATTEDSAGGTLTGRTVTWASSNQAVAIVSSTGLVVGQGPGSTTITATSEGVPGTATIVVIAVPVSTVAVAPGTATIQVAATQQFRDTLKDAGGNVLTGRAVAWSSSDPTIATIDAASGLATGVAPGTVTITATSETKTGTATLVVNPIPVSTVAVSPTNPSIQAGGGATQQFTATLKDANGTVLTGRVVAWSSSDPTIATIDAATGLATGVAAGTVTITATSETKTGTATLVVTPAPVNSVAVLPANPAIVAGATQQFTATLTDAGGKVLSGRVVAWSSSDPTIATIDAATGLATGVVAGTVTITAASETKTGTATLVVTPAPVSAVAVSPPNPGILVGATQPFTATLTDAKGTVLTGRVVTWNTSDATVAAIDATTGIATGVTAGTTTVTATSEGQNGSTVLTVNPAPPPPPPPPI